MPVPPEMSSPTLSVSPLPTCIRPLLLKIDCGDPDTSNVPLFAAAFRMPSKSTVVPDPAVRLAFASVVVLAMVAPAPMVNVPPGPAFMVSAPVALPILSVTLSSVWLREEVQRGATALGEVDGAGTGAAGADDSQAVFNVQLPAIGGDIERALDR